MSISSVLMAAVCPTIYEYFVCVNGCSVSDHKERDLFEGLRARG